MSSLIKKVISLQSSEKFDDSDLTIQDVVIGGPEVPKISLYNNLSEICTKVWLIKESYYFEEVYFIGFIGIPFFTISKCTCGPVALPVLPIRAIAWPLSTL